MLLVLVRHGDSLSEVAPGVFTPDGVLSSLGEQQARLTARRIATLGVTHLLSSPLVRALATATAIAEAVGDLPVEVWTDLREGYGDMPGHPVPIHRSPGRAELLARFPRAHLPDDIADSGWDHGGDNTYELFFARARRLAARLSERFGASDRVVAVGHGGCLNYLLHAFLGIPSSAPVWFDLGHCSLSQVRLVPPMERRHGWPLYPTVTTEVLSVNDRAHRLASGGSVPWTN